jgi:cell division protein FtsB
MKASEITNMNIKTTIEARKGAEREAGRVGNAAMTYIRRLEARVTALEAYLSTPAWRRKKLIVPCESRERTVHPVLAAMSSAKPAAEIKVSAPRNQQLKDGQQVIISTPEFLDFGFKKNK